jgi:hypothetical protein
MTSGRLQRGRSNIRLTPHIAGTSIFESEYLKGSLDLGCYGEEINPL